MSACMIRYITHYAMCLALSIYGHARRYRGRAGAGTYLRIQYRQWVSLCKPYLVWVPWLSCSGRQMCMCRDRPCCQAGSGSGTARFAQCMQLKLLTKPQPCTKNRHRNIPICTAHLKPRAQNRHGNIAVYTIHLKPHAARPELGRRTRLKRRL